MSGVKERLRKESEVFLKPSGSHSSRPIEVRDPNVRACDVARQATRTTVKAKKIDENLRKIRQAQEAPADDPEVMNARLRQTFQIVNERKRKRKEFGTGPTSGGLTRSVQNVAHQYQNQLKDRNLVQRERRLSAEDQRKLVFADENKEQSRKRKSNSKDTPVKAKKPKKEERRASSSSSSGKKDRRNRSSSHDQRERARVKELKTKNETLRKENEALQKKLNVRLESENDALRLCVEATRSENQAAEVPVQREKRQPQPSPEKLKRQDLLQNLRKKRLGKERRLSHSDSEEETPGTAQPDSEDEDLDSDDESVADDSRSVVSEYEEAPRMEIDPEPPMILTEVARNSPRPPPPASPAPSNFSVELKPVNLPENFQSSRIPTILDDTQYETVAGQLEGLMCSQTPEEPAASKGENISESLTTPREPPVVIELTDSDDEEPPAPRQKTEEPTPHPIKVPDTPEDMERWSTEVHSTGEPRLVLEKGYLKHKMELYELIYMSKLVTEHIRPEILNVDDNLEAADDYTGLRRESLDKFLSACRRNPNLCLEKIPE